MKKLLRTAAVVAVTALAVAGCGSGGASNPSNVTPTGEIKPREISWLLSGRLTARSSTS
ncbi:ABC-type glycerol-3-phosphate transport system substrate-binding protein [Arthrobacter globiformis]|nr:ABC-type glycerol-3-phosphate transport system substrate-binding protein [Arthrobacter globiformis]